MKKQLIAIGLAGVLTVPSVALADATVYGSLRTGLEFVSGEGASDATVASFYSRFGLKGSSEVSEGLTASFQIEEGYDSATATTPDEGRIGKVALSGGFGTLALGNLWTASNGHYAGAVNPTLNYGVNGGASSRAARMVSYSSSVGAVGFQIDRHTDANGTATIEFGASTSAGPVNVGFGYWGTEDYEAKNAAGTRVPADDTPKSSFTGFAVSSSLAGMNLTIGVGSTDHGIKNAKKKLVDGKVAAQGNGDSDPVDESQTDVSIVALTGAIGDSGVSYAVQMSDSDKVWFGGADGKTVVREVELRAEHSVHDPSITVVNLTSKLGGSASLIFEHVSKKGKAKDRSLVTLKVDF